MNMLDVIVIICLGYGLIKGLIKGFIVEVSGVIAIFFGVLGAFKFASLFTQFIFKYVDLDPKIVQGICFLILFTGIVYGISLLAKMITKTLQIIALGLLNRIMGGLFGLTKWLVIISSLVLVFNQIVRSIVNRYKSFLCANELPVNPRSDCNLIISIPHGSTARSFSSFKLSNVYSS